MEKRSLKRTWPHLGAGAGPDAALLGPTALRAAAAAVLGAALLLGGCSKEPVPDSGGERVEIAPRVKLPGSAAPSGDSPYTSASTRAEVDPEEEIALAFARSDESAEGVWGDYGAEVLWAVRAPGAGQRALTFESEQYYLFGGLKTRLTGWYPGGGEQAGDPAGYYDAAAGRVSWTIDGGQDILLAQAQAGSVKQRMPAFTFSHALCRLSFRFYAASASALAYWGSVTGVKVCGQRSEAGFALADAAEGTPSLTFTGEASASFEVTDFQSVSPPVGTAADAVAAGSPVMIEPQAGSHTLLLEVTTVNQEGTHTVAVESQAYPAGQSVTICIALGDHEITVQPEGCTIKPWGEAEEVVPGEQSEYPYVVEGNILVHKDMYGAADPALYPTHAPWFTTPTHKEPDYGTNNSGLNTIAWCMRVAKADASNGAAMQGKATPAACEAYAEDGIPAGAWRVPTFHEMKAIVRASGQLTAITPLAAVQYWTGTWREDDTDVRTYHVHGQTGKNGWNNRQTDDCKFPVRCVHDIGGGGGQSLSLHAR